MAGFVGIRTHLARNVRLTPFDGFFGANFDILTPRRLPTVAKRMIGWSKPAPKGVHRGIAQFMGYGSYVAPATEVSVLGGDKIKIHRIVPATDPGYAVNPAQIERQIAGSFVYGLSALFHGGIRVKDGSVEQDNFDSYDSLRIKDMPQVEAIVMPSGGSWSVRLRRPKAHRGFWV